jgi:signal transduction histidine kinase
MKFSFGMRALLFASMVGLALFVVAIAVATSTGLAVRDTVNASVLRARAYANEAARLAAKAASAGPASTAADSIARDPVLDGLFEAALASDPTLIDLGVYDTRGRALKHSLPDRQGEVQERRPPLSILEGGTVLTQARRLLGRTRVYEEIVPLEAGDRSFGEVRVGVSTALQRALLLQSLRTGAWVAAAALGVSLLLALTFAGVLARRIGRAIEGLEKIARGQFGHRLAVEGRDELALLASSINSLGERLEADRGRVAAGQQAPETLLETTGQMAAWARVASGLMHQMADPLNAAALHLNRLRRKWAAPPGEAERHLDVLESEMERLSQIIAGFRRFALIGGWKPEWFDLRAALEEEGQRARDAGRARRVDVRLDLRDLPDRYHSDPALLRQAVSNLLTNAIEAMPGGGELRLSARAVAEGIEIEVADQGVGIPEDVQQRVFDLYFTTRREGTGIGLAVVRQVVQLHGGRVGLESKPGQGTRVTMALPQRSAETVGVA